MKQETLEEAGVAYSKKVSENHTSHMLGFVNGAKWQQERSYSEGDMKSFGDWCRNGLLNTEYGVEKLDVHLEQWKQFKNK